MAHENEKRPTKWWSAGLPLGNGGLPSRISQGRLGHGGRATNKEQVLIEEN